MYTENFMSLTPLSATFDLTATHLPKSIDPRELMIAALSQQNQNLLETMNKAQSVFQETQAKQRQTIDNLSKTNDDLREALLNAEARNKELQLLYEAELKTLKENNIHQKQSIEDLNQMNMKLNENLNLNDQCFKKMDEKIYTFKTNLHPRRNLMTIYFYNELRAFFDECREVISKMNRYDRL